MKRYIPLFVVILILGAGAFYILNIKTSKKEIEAVKKIKIEDFNKIKSCSTLPRFLYARRILRPIIDLSQIHYKGIAFYYGKKFNNVFHKKEWERFDALGTYAIDNKGNIYLTPNPFISIKSATFNLQKAIYKLDSIKGELTRWMVVDEITPTAKNPYGFISIVYDCDNNYLIASAIDKSDYKSAKGRIYIIDLKTKKILQKIEGFDALTLNILKTKNNKYLIVGSARDNGVYIFKFNKDKLESIPFKLFELPSSELRVRKIKIVGKNKLKLEAIKFTYSLIAQTAKIQRHIFIAIYNSKEGKWEIKISK